MKRTQLRLKTMKALKALALSMGIKRPSATRKEDLIEEIKAAEKILKHKHGRARSAAQPKKAATGRAKTATSRAAPKQTLSPAKPAPTPRRTPTSRRRISAPLPPPVSAPTTASFEHKFETPSHPLPPNGGSPYDNLGELPEAYGTGRLFFAARDPHWIYAYWDYTVQQVEEMRRAARHGDLKLRIYAGRDVSAPLFQEITLTPSSHNWFIQVERSDADFYGEFGYYNAQGEFAVASRSRPTHTPADRMSDRKDARFVTIPFHIRFHELFEMVRAHFRDGEELADVLHRLQAAGFRFPFEYGLEPGWSAEQERKLGSYFKAELLRFIQSGSVQVAQWLRPTASGGL
ncbi:MAG: DUF4912 domain-containing protein [Verrucomicrobia bacterium]|nr:DUF4912 domain-containing protein [Verrucomicrobiota bacterium]